MMSVVVALIVLAIAVGVIYWLLKSMGAEGIEIAAPGSCKSGRCGVQPCRTADSNDDHDEDRSGKSSEPGYPR